MTVLRHYTTFLLTFLHYTTFLLTFLIKLLKNKSEECWPVEWRNLGSWVRSRVKRCLKVWGNSEKLINKHECKKNFHRNFSSTVFIFFSYLQIFERISGVKNSENVYGLVTFQPRLISFFLYSALSSARMIFYNFLYQVLPILIIFV